MIKLVCYKIFFIIYKRNEWMQFHWNNLLSKKQRCDTKQSKKIYENKKTSIKRKSKNKHRELSKEEKNIKRKYGRNKYHNISEEKKEKLKEYQKKYREVEKSQSSN